MPEAEFERTFADLAHARLRDRAPGLLDYLVGFQLLDKSDDDTHAVGVWGFKVGPEWLYQPVFFLNGQLKGDELLYIKSQDAFVPLKENWVNYLLNRRPHVLGKPEPMKQQELGIQQPDFDVMARPPHTGSKYASADSLHGLVDYLSARVNEDFRQFLPVVLASPGSDKRAALREKWHLPNFIRRAGKSAALALVNTMRKRADFAESILRFYSMDELLKAAEDALHVKLAAVNGEDVSGAKIKDTTPRVQVMLADRANVLDLDDAMLTPSEKERMQTDRYVVRDGRGDSEISTVYHRQIGETLQTPTQSGYCNVLTAKGTFKPHLLILNPVGEQSRHSRNRGEAVAINLAAGNRVRMISTRNLFVDSEAHDAEAWQTKFNGLPAATAGREGEKLVFVNERCDGAAPFFVRRKIVTDDGQTRYYGEFDRFPYSNDSNDSKLNSTLFPEYRGRKFNVSDAEGSDRFPAVERSGREYGYTQCFIITGKDGRKITQIGDDYFVPNGYKLVRISKDDIERYKLEDFQRDQKGVTRDGVKVPPREPADEELASPQTLADIEMRLFKSAQACVLSPVSDGIEYWLKVDGKMGRPMRKLAAFKELVTRYGMREHTANSLLKLASKTPPEFIVKLAQGWEGQPNTPPAIPEPMYGSDPTVMGGPAVQYPQQELLDVGSDPGRRDATVMDMDATYQAQRAAQQGQKEVMDTSVVGGLVKTMDPEAVVDNYLGDLLLGLDRVGRILFMLYWHWPKFKERYGDQDMPELEDSLRNVFDSMGDLVLFLRAKTIEPDVTSATAEAELTEVL